MLSEVSADSPTYKRIGLLVDCAARTYETVLEEISGRAPRNWENASDICVLPIPDARINDTVFVSSEINRVASRLQRDLRLLTVGAVRFNSHKLRNQLLPKSLCSMISRANFSTTVASGTFPLRQW